jgi:hypothetical protein
MAAPSEIYARIYDNFRTSISRYDCGQHCAKHNNGEPVCCTTRHAVPIVDKTELELLRSRTNIWTVYEPTDAGAGIRRPRLLLGFRGSLLGDE